MAPLVVVRDLSVRVPAPDAGATARRALDAVSLTIDAGEVVGIVGATGSGRSTLLRCLAGIVPQLVPATVEGTLEVAGRDPRVTPVAELAGDVAVVFDDPEAQLSQPTVAEEVAFGLENLGVPVTEMRERVGAALELVGLAGFEGRNPLTLSGGEQQRLVVACAVAIRPRLLLLDEPTANLDPRSGRRLLELVRELATGEGMAVVVVAHDVELLAEVVGRIVVLETGRIVFDGSTAAAFTALARTATATGAGVPAVTALIARIDAQATALPVTVDGAAAWLAGRA